MVRRLKEKVLLEPKDIRPSREDFEVIGVFNPAAIRVGQEIFMLARVAERPIEARGSMAPSPRAVESGNGFCVEIDWITPQQNAARDVRVHFFEGNRMRLTFISYFLLVKLDRTGFTILSIDQKPSFFPLEEYEEYGVEDPRITPLGDHYYISYVACSRKMGVCTALAETEDFNTFTRRGIIFPMENKDVVILPEKIGNDYFAYHRPGGHYKFEYLSMQCARSTDLIHWGRHQHLISPRPGFFDEHKIGGGAVPLKIPQGWLEIYHGVNCIKGDDPIGMYQAGAALFDLHDPAKLLGRSRMPIIKPESSCEKQGFVPNVVFPTACLLDLDSNNVLIYCGAADERVEVIALSLDDILATLE
jgi:beta-1,2-mannobiose phosphorylase / 1,2-beta-oligomannan phosphorylase